MITLRPSNERGHANHGWLDTHHTFSFADYYDEAHMGFRALRVINEDRVTPQTGFGTHGHRDMEILTWVLEGALDHRDSMGNGSTIRPGEMQRMTAGTGVRHSEANSAPAPVHFFQIWVLPKEAGLTPSYEQKAFPESTRQGVLRLVADRTGRDGAVTVHQDVSLYASLLSPGQEVSHALAKGRHAWVQVARGEVTLNGQTLRAGDGAQVSNEERLTLRATRASEFLLFDLS